MTCFQNGDSSRTNSFAQIANGSEVTPMDTNRAEELDVVETILNSSLSSVNTDEESESEPLNDSANLPSSPCRWVTRNETSVHCSSVRDLHVSSFMVVAIASDKGIHLFIPRYLCLSVTRNAIYRHVLVPSPVLELREYLAHKTVNSFGTIASFSNLLMCRRVRWAPFSLHVAGLTNDGQLFLVKVDLSKSSAETFPVCNISKMMLEKFTVIHSNKPSFANNAVVRKSAEYGEVTHFAWVQNRTDWIESKTSLDLVVVNKKLQLFHAQLDRVLLNGTLQTVTELESTPCCVTACCIGAETVRVLVAFTNGAVNLFILNETSELRMAKKLAPEDYIPVSCAEFIGNYSVVCFAKYRTIFFATYRDEEDQAVKVCKFDTVENFAIYRIKCSSDHLYWITKSGNVSSVHLPDESLLSDFENIPDRMERLCERDEIELESKYSKYIMGSNFEQAFTSIDLSFNAEFLFFVYEDGCIAKRERRDYKLVCMSTEGNCGQIDISSPLSCLNSDYIFTEKWFVNNLFLDPAYFWKKLWGNKVEMVSGANGSVKFSHESIADLCPMCSQSIVTLTNDLTGWCVNSHDWPICCRGHVIEKPKDIIVCLMCRIVYCTTHKPYTCNFCYMPVN